MEQNQAITALSALAQASRLVVFKTLVVAGPQGMVAGDIATQLALSATTLSFHLKALVQAGLVTQERDGRFLIYRARVDAVAELVAYLMDNCCQGQACWPSVAPGCSDPQQPTAGG